MSGPELIREEGAFRGGRRQIRVPILERRAFRHVHHAMVSAVSAAARGQARLRTGRNERHERPEPVQENETNTHDTTHGAPSYPEIKSKADSAYSISSRLCGPFLAERQNVLLVHCRRVSLPQQICTKSASVPQNRPRGRSINEGWMKGIHLVHPTHRIAR